jgi:hypothetical protein
MTTTTTTKAPQGVYPFAKGKNKVTRQMRRHATIIAGGKEVNVIDFLRERAKHLPALVNTETKKPYDHVEILKKVYMERGINGVNEYLAICRNVVRRDRGKTVFIRGWGWLVLQYNKYIKY